MKTLNTILINRWHLHFGVGSYIMAILIVIMTMSDPINYSSGLAYEFLSFFYQFGETLRIGEIYLILTLGTAIIYAGFERYQSGRIPMGSKPSIKDMRDDVIAGVAGGTGYIVSDLIGINIIYLIVVAVICIGLEIYKRKQVE